MEPQLAQALALLGVTENSDGEAVTRAYRRLARATHPDVSPAPDAAERFATVEAAYRLVSQLPHPSPHAESFVGTDSGFHSRRARASGHASGPRSTPPARAGDADDKRDFAETPATWTFPLASRRDVLQPASPFVWEAGWGRPPIVAGPVVVHAATPNERTELDDG